MTLCIDAIISFVQVNVAIENTKIGIGFEGNIKRSGWSCRLERKSASENRKKEKVEMVNGPYGNPTAPLISHH